MFKVIKKDIVKVTPQKAEEFLKINTFEEQRPIKLKHVAYLKRVINEGTFITAEIGVASLNYDSKRSVLVNGQHTSLAVKETGKTVDALVETFAVDSSEDLSILYRQFDAQASRSLADISRPEAYALGIDWMPKITSLVISTACLKENKTSIHKSLKVELLRKYLPFGKFLNSFLHNKEVDSQNVKILLRSAVTHAILLSWERSQEDTKHFWTQVRDGENLKKYSPMWKLRNYLQQTGVNYGRGANAGLRSSTYHEMTSKCIAAWNAYRKNENTDLKYYREKPIPRAI